jgi:stearoyl-CoA desaturase (delta-9 desaturase)
MSPGMMKAYVLLVVIVPLAATLFALGAFAWYEGSFRDVGLFLAFYVATAVGVTVGYHRMLTHRSLDTGPITKGILLILGSFGLEGDPIHWAATHIKHHANADAEGDPHSPVEGLWHAHAGWIANREDVADPKVYVPHLLADPVVRFVARTYLVWLVASFALPALLGGWTGLLWGGLVRMFFVHHVTWSVNSICHLFGRRPYQTGDRSANNWVVAVLGFGEGWHNNHHAFPQSAFHGLRSWEVDFAGYFIRLLRRLGLVWNVHVPTPELMAVKARVPERAAAPG